MYILGTSINNKKKLHVSLTECFGFGECSKQRFKAKTGYNLRKNIDQTILKKKDLLVSELIKGRIKKKIGVLFRQIFFRNLITIRKKKTLRALRHSLFLPVRNQRTRKNAQTQKSKQKNRKKIAIAKKKK
jgi:ribosomal protein S13